MQSIQYKLIPAQGRDDMKKQGRDDMKKQGRDDMKKDRI